jgi:hypothetical protein
MGGWLTADKIENNAAILCLLDFQQGVKGRLHLS